MVWRVKAGGLAPATAIEELKTLLMQDRSITAADDFFNIDYERHIHDPLKMYDMEAAVERLVFAIAKGERIVVHGDYDADGISSTAILVTTLQKLGATVIPFLPHREDHGYGLNQGVMEALAKDFDVLLTVDCGISNIEEISWVVAQGKDVIIVDHHEIPAEMPPARAVLHPRHPKGSYPFGHLCGAGVAWKLAAALWRDRRLSPNPNFTAEIELLDLAALGTVADVMPLMGENRAIVHYGLKMLRSSARPGIKALLEQARLLGPISVEDLAFRVIPKINAAGRMDHAQPALDVLLATTKEQADKAAAQLLALNVKRQNVTKKIMSEAKEGLDLSSPIIFVSNPSWPAGVVGLAAGRLASEYERPAVVIGGVGSRAVGSARSPKGYNILKLLQSGQEHVLKLGGHAQAAGFSLAQEKLSAFHQALLKGSAEMGAGSEEAIARQADAIIDHSLLTWETHEMITRFEPFGEANRQPSFIIQNIPLIEARPIGKTGTHARLVFGVNGSRLSAIGFGLAEKIHSLGKHVDVLGRLESNEWHGRVELQMNVEDIAPAGYVTISL